ncbi:hypothetical protein [Helicobacter cynogastricus]|uniref:hypothetical protein n=1 Tax=Helicobacter cynogastricus TaxID=329937 RepID=UPI000CF0F06E|nr:hypothetical protein [Helicobacter cynogastricus]
MDEAIPLPPNLDPLKKARANARPEVQDLPTEIAKPLKDTPTQQEGAQEPPAEQAPNTTALRVAKIEAAIQNILDNLANGIEISKYEIDGIRIERRSPLDLINQLEKLKTKMSKKPLPRFHHFKF